MKLVSPMLLNISHIIVESNEATKSHELTSSDSPTLAPTSPSLVSNIDIPIALRKEPHNCPSTRYPLHHFCTYANLSTNHCVFTTHLDSNPISKNVIMVLQIQGGVMQEKI
jgi:hypothetical protein